ncbi:MAG: ion transporter [Cyanobacteriota bacterium]|nr:ion transporter [Cyanobacteriota bacterium]
MLTRKDIAFYLEDIETTVGRTISLTILGLILISSIAFIAETYDLPASVLIQLKRLDLAIVILFSIEYILRLISSEKPIRFLFSFNAIIDLLVILPFVLGLGNTLFLRIFRWFRILRLIRFLELEFSIFKVTSEDGLILAKILFTLFTIVFISSGLIYQVEHPKNPELFRNFLDAFYFSVVTMTTVGFGDVTPLSEMGRCLTLLMIVAGVSIVPWQLRELIQQLVKTANYIQITCSSCGWSSHDTDALYCKRCGTKLDRESSIAAQNEKLEIKN